MKHFTICTLIGSCQVVVEVTDELWMMKRVLIGQKVRFEVDAMLMNYMRGATKRRTTKVSRHS